MQTICDLKKFSGVPYLTHDDVTFANCYIFFLDTFVGGGFAEGSGVLQTAIRELEEEAGLILPPHLKLKPCGSVSFFHISERGLHPQTEFVYDLELPLDFLPENKDGEVQGFELVRSDQLINLIQTEVRFSNFLFTHDSIYRLYFFRITRRQVFL